MPVFRSAGFDIVQYEKTGSFIEAIVQLRIVYWDRNILPIVKNIPIIRSIARLMVFGGNNAWAAFCKALMPNNQDLYLNNIVLAKKQDI